MLDRKLISARYNKIESRLLNDNDKVVYSTLDYHKSIFWGDFCTTIDVTRLSAFSRIVKIVRSGVKTFKYDKFFVTGGERTDLLALSILSLIPWVTRKFVVVDAHWQKKSGVVGLLQNTMLFFSRRIITQIQVHSDEEKELYPLLFPIDKNRIKVIPFSTSIMGYKLNLENNEFILSGGGSFRNYKPIIEISNDLPISVKLGIPESFMRNFSYLESSKNIEIISNWSNSEYFSQMSKCEIFLMPLESGLNRTAGDQTILNAMFMRKVVVISNSITARAYIKHGVTGLIYNEGDSSSLLEVINYWIGLSSTKKKKILDKAEFEANTKFSEQRRLLKTAIMGIS